MKTFLRVFAELVLGTMTGFDRLVFRGHLREYSCDKGMLCYLAANRVLYKDFDRHVQAKTKEMIDGSVAEALGQRRPVQYLPSSQTEKDALARHLAQRDGIQEGLIAVFKCVEPCRTFECVGNRREKILSIRGKQGRCS